MSLWTCRDVVMCERYGFFFFQAEDGIRDAQESRGLGDVYKRQVDERTHRFQQREPDAETVERRIEPLQQREQPAVSLSLIHI